MSLFIRKALVAFGVAALAVFVTASPSLIDLFESQDWGNLKTAAWSLVMGAIAAGFRALVSLLTAFVPSDADHGVSLVGKFKP